MPTTITEELLESELKKAGFDDLTFDKEIRIIGGKQVVKDWLRIEFFNPGNIACVIEIKDFKTFTINTQKNRNRAFIRKIGFKTSPFRATLQFEC